MSQYLLAIILVPLACEILFKMSSVNSTIYAINEKILWIIMVVDLDAIILLEGNVSKLRGF